MICENVAVIVACMKANSKEKNGHGAALHGCTTDFHGSNTWIFIRVDP
jgi:hypothetical protein